MDVLLIGTEGSGKSNYLQRIAKCAFPANEKINNVTTTVVLNDTKVRVTIGRDLEMFDALLVMFSANSRQEYLESIEIICNVREVFRETPIVWCASKIDLNRCYTLKEAIKASDNDVTFCEISSLKNVNITKPLSQLYAVLM